MANIPLQSISFPGLSDKYTTPTVDATLTQTGAAADAKKTGDEIAGLKNDLTQGTFLVGNAENAEQLTSTVGIEDKTPYLFRTSGGSVDIGDRETVNKIVGGTIVNNQLVKNGDFSDGETNWVKVNANVSVSNGVYTVTKTASDGYACWQSIPMIATHKVLQTFHIKGADGVKYNMNGEFPQLTGNGAWQVVERVTVRSQTANIVFLISTNETSDFAEFSVKNVMYIDLTQMFGTSIADYVYSLEATTAGAGVVWLKKHFPKQFDAGYQAYDAGTLKSIEGLSAKKTVGFNQWDEEVVHGYYDANGVFYSNSGFVASKNKIRVVPNTVYNIHSGSGYIGRIVWLDSSDNAVGSSNNGTSATDWLATSPANANYLLFNMANNYGGTYNHDICINLHWDGEKDGTYEPYKTWSYALDDSVVIRGIPKVDAQGNLYYDGDEYLPDGTVNRRYGVVDLGTLNWTIGTFNDITYFNVGSSQLPDLKKPASSLDDNNYRCGKYVLVRTGGVTEEFIDKSFFVYTSGVLYFRDDSYNDASAFKTGVSGVYMVYEKATATTETAEPYQSTQIVDDFGTEEFVLADTAFPVPVGHETYYQNNLRAKLEMSPDSPDGDGLYVVQQESGENTYVPLASTATIQDILTRLTALENA